MRRKFLTILSLLFLGMVLSQTRLQAETVRLEDLDLSLMSVGWGGAPRLNKVIR